MKILAVEFSSNQKSVAVLADGVCASAMESGHAVNHPFELIERALAGAHLEREQIECLAVGLGPGSYHGIRAAISLAQGWSLARPVKTFGIPAMEAMAFRAGELAWRGGFSFIIDAQRNEFYRADFEIGTDSFQETGVLRIVPAAEIAELEKNGGALAGPGIRERFPRAAELHPDAEAVARLAARRTAFIPAEELVPIYLRETAFVKAPPPRHVV